MPSALPRFALPIDLACRHWVNYSVFMKRPIVNLEEKIGKTVGKRIAWTDSFAAGMKLQETALALHKSFDNRWAPKGVYRFKTHEEADEWMMRMLARSQIKRS